MNIRKKSYSQFTILDLFCMVAGFFLGIFIRHGDFRILDTYSVYQEVLIVLGIAIIANAFFFRPYEDIFRRGSWIEFINVMKCLGVQLTVAVVYMFVVQNGAHYSRLAFAYACISIFVITYFGRLILKKIMRNAADSWLYRKKLLVVSTSEKAEALLSKSRAELEFNYNISALAIMDKDMIGETIAGVPVTANAESLYDDARLMVVDSVLIALEPENPQFKDTVNLFHVMGVEVNISLADYNLGIPNQRIVKMGDLTVLSGNSQTMPLGMRLPKEHWTLLVVLWGLFLQVFLC